MKRLGQIIAFFGGVTIAVGGLALMLSPDFDHRFILAAVIQLGSAALIGGLLLSILRSESKNGHAGSPAAAKPHAHKSE